MGQSARAIRLFDDFGPYWQFHIEQISDAYVLPFGASFQVATPNFGGPFNAWLANFRHAAVPRRHSWIQAENVTKHFLSTLVGHLADI